MKTEIEIMQNTIKNLNYEVTGVLKDMETKVSTKALSSFKTFVYGIVVTLICRYEGGLWWDNQRNKINLSIHIELYIVRIYLLNLGMDLLKQEVEEYKQTQLDNAKKEEVKQEIQKFKNETYEELKKFLKSNEFNLKMNEIKHENDVRYKNMINNSIEIANIKKSVDIINNRLK